jgi:hypothetical protein
MNMTFSGSKTKPRRVPTKAVGSIRDSEFDLNEIDESDLQFEKHDEQRTFTFRGTVIDLRAEPSNAFDSMRCSCESFSNEIDLQFEKHNEQRNSVSQGIVINVISWRSKEHGSMQATRRLAARGGKKADEGTMTLSPDPNPNTVADPSATQTLTPARTEALDILTTIHWQI